MEFFIAAKCAHASSYGETAASISGRAATRRRSRTPSQPKTLRRDEIKAYGRKDDEPSLEWVRR